jgi:hypothetical protein
MSCAFLEFSQFAFKMHIQSQKSTVTFLPRTASIKTHFSDIQSMRQVAFCLFYNKDKISSSPS